MRSQDIAVASTRKGQGRSHGVTPESGALRRLNTSSSPKRCSTADDSPEPNRRPFTIRDLCRRDRSLAPAMTTPICQRRRKVLVV
jgi:hypothetical protein